MLVLLHAYVELDDREQIAPILDDLKDRYGGFEASWMPLACPPWAEIAWERNPL